MSEGRASKLRQGSALVDPRFSLMDLSTSPTTETTMQTTQTPPPLTPGTILASPQGRERLTIADTYVSPTGRATVRYLAGDVLWTWPLHPTARVLAEMGFVIVGQEDPEVLAERVALAQATYRARRAA